jgi:type II secretory pathway component GspD/PulD (secretin)
MIPTRCALLVAVGLILPSPVLARQGDPVTAHGDSVSVRFVDADVRGVVQALGRHLDRPVVLGEVGGGRISLETPRPIPRSEVVALLRSVLESQNLQLIDEGGVYRVRPLHAVRPDPFHGGFAAAPLRPPGDVELFVIRLRHARASDVAATVNALYGRASALGEPGGRPPFLSEELRQSRVQPLHAAPDAPGATGPGRNATLAGEVTIVPDTRTNSMLVRASRGDFELVQAVVEQLDVRPLQVLIEVLIAEVRRDRGLDIGLGAGLPAQLVPGTTDNTTVQGSTAGLGLGDFVLRVMNIGGVNLDVTLRAAASRGDVSILSRPVLLTANNERAQILVGSQRPFVQVQRALPTESPVRDQVVQYKDVGTQLSVRPTISADGYVMLEVVQEVNAATTETAFDAPVISTRAVQTQLLVRDGQTAVLGGLADRQRDVTRGGVPILSGLPLLGWLFGRHTRRTTETELFLFLTPRVIRDDGEMDATTDDVREATRRIRSTVNRALDRSPATRERERTPPSEPEEEQP